MRVTFLLYEGVEPVDLAAIGVISMAKRVIPQVSYETVAVSRTPVVLSNGLTVVPDRALSEVNGVDVLLVPGGPGWRAAASDERILSFVARVGAQADVCSVCTGAMILASAGVLDGRKATTKTQVVEPETSPLEEMRERFPRVWTTEALVVESGNVVTGGGVTLCIDATLYLLEKRFGRTASDEVARIMEYGAARAANALRFARLEVATS